MPPADSSPLLNAARELAPVIRAMADRIEEERRLPQSLVEQLIDAGMLHAALPQEYGGRETDPLTVARVVEELSAADGSVGWCVMLHLQNCLLSGAMPRALVEAIWGRDQRATIAGHAQPRGRATPAGDGYRVSGRWSFASGSSYASWLSGACQVMDGNTPLLDTNGLPVTVFASVPAERCTILDTWKSTGLRGTASHDFVMDDVFVPAALVASTSILGPAAQRWHANPMYGCLPLVFVTHGSHALGLAHAALDELTDIASAKTPAGQTSPLREQAHAQVQVASAPPHS
jgi:indole-3-acetate monooxygenase